MGPRGSPREKQGKAGSGVVSGVGLDGKRWLEKTMMLESGLFQLVYKNMLSGFSLYKQPNKENHLAWVQRPGAHCVWAVSKEVNFELVFWFSWLGLFGSIP